MTRTPVEPDRVAFVRQAKAVLDEATLTLVCVHPLRRRVEVPKPEAGSIRLRQPVRVTVEGDNAIQTGAARRIARSSRV